MVPGDMPVNFLKVRIKFEQSLKPEEVQVSLTLTPLYKSFLASAMRRWMI